MNDLDKKGLLLAMAKKKTQARDEGRDPDPMSDYHPELPDDHAVLVRLDPDKWFVPGNVMVMSNAAARMKGDSTYEDFEKRLAEDKEFKKRVVEERQRSRVLFRIVEMEMCALD